jgi:hypothetical protein
LKLETQFWLGKLANLNAAKTPGLGVAPHKPLMLFSVMDPPVECTLGYMVQACHIHEHSKSRNNDPGNGLALTTDAHWMFDKGLWTAIPKGDDFIIHVAIGNYTESTAHGEFLARHHGRALHFDANAKLRPAVEHLDWHRRYHGIAS